MSQKTKTQTEQATNHPQGARYSKEDETETLGAEVENGEIVIEIGDSQDEATTADAEAAFQRGRDVDNHLYTREQAGKKQVATLERHANGYAQQSHCWGGTFNPSEAKNSHRFRQLKRTQNVGEYDLGETGGLHTNTDARIYRRFQSICQGLELPASIQERAGRLLSDVRELPREVCKSWGSELTIAACLITAVEDFDYALDFDEVYEHLPKHPERSKEDARGRVEMALREVQDRHRHRNGVEDPVINNMSILTAEFDLNPLTVKTAEGLYEALGHRWNDRPEAHSYGTTAPVVAAGYVHAVAQILPDETQEAVVSRQIAEPLNLTRSAVSCPSKAIQCTVEGTVLDGGVPAVAGVEPYANGKMTPTVDLVEELQRVADELGKKPTKDEMDEHGEFSARVFANRFGSWNDATELVTLRSKGEQVKGDELIAELQRVAEKLGKSPTVAEMNEHGKYSVDTYISRFGSWNEAKETTGLEVCEPNKPVSDDALIAELKRLADELDKSPTLAEMDELGKYGISTYNRRFGSWNEAKEAAGLKAFGRGSHVSDDELIAELKRLAGELDKSPTVVEMKEHGKHAINTYYNRFESWNEAKEIANV